MNLWWWLLPLDREYDRATQYEESAVGSRQSHPASARHLARHFSNSANSRFLIRLCQFFGSSSNALVCCVRLIAVIALGSNAIKVSLLLLLQHDPQAPRRRDPSGARSRLHLVRLPRSRASGCARQRTSSTSSTQVIHRSQASAQGLTRRRRLHSPILPEDSHCDHRPYH